MIEGSCHVTVHIKLGTSHIYVLQYVVCNMQTNLFVLQYVNGEKEVRLFTDAEFEARLAKLR